VPHIFVSYAREDAVVARALVDALQEAGHDVWWDALLPGGARFRDAIEQQIDAAEAVLVVWSAHSRNSRYVLDEAERAGRLGTLLSLLLGGEPPLGFGSMQGVDLSTWDGEPDGAAWGRILEGIAQVQAARRSVTQTPARPGRPWWRDAVAPTVGVGALLGTALWLTHTRASDHGGEALLSWPLLDAWATGIAAAAPVALLAARESADRGLRGWRPATRRSLVWYGRAVLLALVVAALAALGGAFDGRAAAAGASARIADLVRATLLLTMAFAALAAASMFAWRQVRRLLSGSAPPR